MRWLILILVFAGSLLAQTTNNNILPASTGLNLGATNQRWNGFFQNVDIAGNCTIGGQSCLTAILNLASPGPIGTTTPGIANFTAMNANGTYSPVFFGAKCDGVTDDTTAFAAAFNAAPFGGTIVIPPSTSGCLLNTGITITADSITIQGMGFPYDRSTVGTAWASRLLFAAGQPGITVTGRGFKISDVSISSKDSGAAPADIGLHLEGKAPYIERVGVYGFGGKCIDLDSLTLSSNVDFWTIISSFCQSNFDDGLYLAGGGDENVGTAIDYHGIVNGGICLNITGGVTNTFINPTCEANTGGSYNLTNTQSNRFLNAYCENSPAPTSTATFSPSAFFNYFETPSFGGCLTITNSGGSSNMIVRRQANINTFNTLGIGPDNPGNMSTGHVYMLRSGAAATNDFSIQIDNTLAPPLILQFDFTGQQWKTAYPWNSAVTTGTAPLVIASTTPVANLTASNHPKIFACGTTTTCAATAQAIGIIAHGTVTLTGGTATVASLPTFTSTTSFQCTASDRTSITTGPNAVPASASSITVTGTGTDVIDYICAGN